MEKIIRIFLVILIGVGLGYGWRMYHEANQPRRAGLLVQPTENVDWSISEIRDRYTSIRQQRYIARDNKGNITLLIKSPPFDVWVIGNER